MTKAYTRAQERLVLAQKDCEYNRGWAQWCNGCRTAPGYDTAGMRGKEALYWARYERAAKKRDRALAHLIAVVRKEAK